MQALEYLHRKGMMHRDLKVCVHLQILFYTRGVYKRTNLIPKPKFTLPRPPSRKNFFFPRNSVIACARGKTHHHHTQTHTRQCDNVMLRGGVAKLADFGLASTRQSITGQGVL